jgi:hypothetical protein
MTFDVRRERIDVTRRTGLLADRNRVYQLGDPQYQIDGQAVADAEFRRLWAIAHPDHPLP